MAISADYITKLIGIKKLKDEYEDDPKRGLLDVRGEKKYEEWIHGGDFNPEAKFDSKASLVTENIGANANGCIKSLIYEIQNFIPSFSRRDMLVDVRFDKSSEEYVVAISFRPDAVFRPSVVQDPKVASKWDRYGQLNGKFGTDDIILQLTKGYTARDSIWYSDYDTGDWKWTRKSYTPPYDFVAAVVDDINNRAAYNALVWIEEEIEFNRKTHRHTKVKIPYRVPSYAYLVGEYK